MSGAVNPKWRGMLRHEYRHPDPVHVAARHPALDAVATVLQRQGNVPLGEATGLAITLLGRLVKDGWVRRRPRRRRTWSEDKIERVIRKGLEP